MNHAVRRRSNDHDAQPKGTQILLVLKTPIHAQQDIETPLSTPKQLTVRRARPACVVSTCVVVPALFKVNVNNLSY